MTGRNTQQSRQRAAKPCKIGCIMMLIVRVTACRARQQPRRCCAICSLSAVPWSGSEASEQVLTWQRSATPLQHACTCSRSTAHAQAHDEGTAATTGRLPDTARLIQMHTTCQPAAFHSDLVDRSRRTWASVSVTVSETGTCCRIWTWISIWIWIWIWTGIGTCRGCPPARGCSCARRGF